LSGQQHLSLYLVYSSSNAWALIHKSKAFTARHAARLPWSSLGIIIKGVFSISGWVNAIRTELVAVYDTASSFDDATLSGRDAVMTNHGFHRAQSTAEYLPFTLAKHRG